MGQQEEFGSDQEKFYIVLNVGKLNVIKLKVV